MCVADESSLMFQVTLIRWVLPPFVWMMNLGGIDKMGVATICIDGGEVLLNVLRCQLTY